MTTQPSKRLLEIDVLRGLAIAGMVVYHYAFALVFFGLAELDIFSGGWLWLARIVQFIFLGLVGVSLGLSRRKAGFARRQMRRFLLISGSALLVTLVTYLVVPEAYVRFGILHLIAFSILVLAPLAGQKWLMLGLAAVVIAVADPVNDWLDLGFYTIDYFAVFPWISLPMIGIFLGNTIYANGEPLLKLRGSVAEALAWAGRKSLIIYLVHVPLIVGFLHFLYDLNPE